MAGAEIVAKARGVIEVVIGAVVARPEAALLEEDVALDPGGQEVLKMAAEAEGATIEHA